MFTILKRQLRTSSKNETVEGLSVIEDEFGLDRY